MEHHEAVQIVQGRREARALGLRAALATIVRVTGSAYRREGTRMLIREDGVQTCMVSGGCLEPEIAARALEVMQTGQAIVVPYDLSEDLVWGLGIGCGGAVDVRIERVDQSNRVLDAWFAALEAGEPAALVTPLGGAEGRMLVLGTGEVLGELSEDALPAAQGILTQPTPHARSVFLNRAELFVDVSTPPAELVIFGAGHDARPLSRLAVDLGYTVRVVDVRAAFATPEHFPGAQIELVAPEDFAEQLPLTERSHVVVMNHHLERDQWSLAHALAGPAPFVGLLGPRSRFEQLQGGLRDAGQPLTPAQAVRVRTPVGLRLGAESPEEIALSILGELMALRRGQGGGFLSGHAGRIHDAVGAD